MTNEQVSGETNPLVRELKERGYQGYVQWLRGPGGAIERGEVRDLTADAAREAAFTGIRQALASIGETETIEVARPKLDKDGKQRADEHGDPEFVTKRVLKRPEMRKRLLAQHGISEAEMAAWEARGRS